MKMMFPSTRVNRTFGEWASDVNTLVDSLFTASADGTASSASFTPRMDIYETDDKFVATFDLPGVKLADVNIDLNEDDLVIHGNRQATSEAQDDRFYRVERWHGEFRRSLRLPRSVDREQIAADYQDGVLSVWLPKSKAAAARKISIRGGESTESSS